jgi:hypothetical protein
LLCPIAGLTLLFDVVVHGVINPSVTN